MKWAQKQRLKFIEEQLCQQGFINRQHLMQEFEISMPQASLDLREFMAEKPRRMLYNKSAKRYEVRSAARSA